MAKSRLHELTEQGVSVWIDSLSREMLETGELARLMKEDAVVGVTSNPTIFQKALSSGDWYDERLAEVLKTEDDPNEIFLALAIEDIREACDLLRPVWDERRGLDGCVSLEVDPTLAYDREATFEQAMRLHEEVERPNLFVKIPATKPGLGAIEDCIAKGKSINVTLIFSLERYAAVAEAYLRGLERLVAAGGDPRKVASVASFFVSRVDTEADRRLDEVGGEATKLEGKLAIANAKLAYQHWQETFSGPRWEFLAGKGATIAALPLGVDLDEEPGVPRRALRRGADRAGDRQHDAGRDDRRLPGSRRGRADTLTRASTRREELLERARGGGRRLRRRRRDARGGGRPEVRRLVRRAAGRDPRQARRARRGVTPDAQHRRADLGARRVALDRADEAAGSGWLDASTAMRAARRRAELVRRGRRSSSSTTACCSGWAARRSRPRCCGGRSRRVVPRPRHDASRGDPPARAATSTSSGRSSSSPRSRARRSRRARTSSTSGELPAAAARSSPRSPTPAPSSSSSANERGFRGDVRGRARDRRPLLGAVAVRARARGADGRRRRAIPAGGGRDGRRAATATRATRGSSSACGSARAGARPRQGLLRRDADGLRALGGAAARGVDRQAGQGARAGPRRAARRAGPPARRGRASPTRTSSGGEFFRWEFATAVAGHVLGINPFDQPDVQAAKDKTSEVLAGGRARPRAAGLARRAARPGRRDGDYVAIQAFIDPARERELEPLVAACARDGLRRHARASARATCTRPASCTRAGRTPASSSRSSTRPATSCRSRAATSASAG